MSPERALRILVVDDDPAMVGAITALVGVEGHQVITAYDGLTAIKRFDEEQPDIVLLDLAMPGPDGFAVAGRIRAAGRDADPGRLRRERRGRQGARAGHRRRRLPDQALRTGRAPGPHPCPRPPLRDGVDRRGRRRHLRPVAWSSSRPATGPGSVTSALDLTPTEFRLLDALARAGGDVVPHVRLARAGWPAEPDPDLLWLKPHLTRLRAKVVGRGRADHPGRQGRRLSVAGRGLAGQNSRHCAARRQARRGISPRGVRRR